VDQVALGLIEGGLVGLGIDVHDVLSGADLLTLSELTGSSSPLTRALTVTVMYGVTVPSAVRRWHGLLLGRGNLDGNGLSCQAAAWSALIWVFNC